MDDGANSSEMSDVASRQEGDGQDVMGKHLPMIVSPLFGIDHVNLVKPPSELGQVVEFGEGRKGLVGVC